MSTRQLLESALHRQTMLNEANDCSVIALSLVSGLDYLLVREDLKNLGLREPGVGVNTADLVTWLDAHDYLVMTRYVGDDEPVQRRLSELLPDMAEGRYLVVSDGHVDAVVDDVVTGSPGDDPIVDIIWRVYPGSADMGVAA